MVVAAIVSLYLQLGLGWDSDDPKDFANLMLVTVGITTVAWIAVTFLTPAEPEEKLISFYLRVRPDGPGWRHIAQKIGLGVEQAGGSLGMQFYNWILGCILIYGSLFGVGKLCFKEWLSGLGYLAIAAIAAIIISRNLSRANWTGLKTDEGKGIEDKIPVNLSVPHSG